MDITQFRPAAVRGSTRRATSPAIALAAALAIGSAFGMARAASTPPAAVTATATSATPATPTASTAAKATAAPTPDTTDALLTFSQAGRDAFDNIRMARLDLFNGNTATAMKEMKSAQKALITARAEAPTFATRTQTTVMGKVVGTSNDKVTADAVPVGGDLILADNFQLSDQHQPVLARAREHLAQGNKKAAVQVLKAGNIDVSYNRQWLPIASAEQNLDKAISLATAGNYYDANLALKVIVDGVRTDNVSFDLPPAVS
jgi:hypothetical protein